MADRPPYHIKGDGLILSLSVFQAAWLAVTGGRNDGDEIGFWGISEEGREGKIKADPPKGRYVLVCTSFFREIPPKVRDWWEISRRLASMQVPVNGGLLWRPRLVSGRRWIQVPMARAVSSFCKSDLA